MRCPVCKNGESRPGTVTLTLVRVPLTMVVRHVPAQICDDCGEEYIDETATQQALDQTEASARQGVHRRGSRVYRMVAYWRQLKAVSRTSSLVQRLHGDPRRLTTTEPTRVYRAKSGVKSLRH
ncbi:MAG: type II toxin-antitoxin system MqsA family antitoxin [Geminicoccaceae bacterium]|nr:type II toxin-antitoxin system MqsA family antitoxin [Geminicoccaceae bacterium]